MASKENVRMKAVYDYTARTPNELSFKKGQSVFVFSSDDDGWASGWFPSSYVTPDTALTEMVSAQTQETAVADTDKNKNIDRRSLLLQKQQTSTHLNEALTNRPDREQLEQKHILAPGAAPAVGASASVAVTAKPAAVGTAVTAGGVKKEDPRADAKKKGLGGIFGFGKKKDVPAPSSGISSSTGGLSSSAGSTAPMVTTIGGSGPAPGQSALRAARYFRVALQQLPDMKDGSRQLPSIVESCVDYIRKTALDLEGIFRISGLASEVDGLQKQFESGDYSGKLRSNDPHAVAGVLKKFFRELPEPLMTLENHKPFLDTLKIDQANQPAALRPLVETLPALNLRIIKHMIPFLFTVSKHKDRNMMNPVNLSIVFGPTFMRSAEENRTGVPDGTNRGAAVIENLILHCEAIFGPVEGANNTGPAMPTASRPPASTTTITAPPAVLSVTHPKGGSMRQQAGLPVSPRPVPALAVTADGAAQPEVRSTSNSNPPAPSGSRVQPAPPPRAAAVPGGSVISPPPAGIKPPSRSPAKAAAPAAAPAPPAPAVAQKQVRALYDYKGDPAKGQLSFAGGELIVLISQHESGEIRGHKGYFPSTFVESA